MSKKVYIGVSGLARVGKNLFCDIAIKQLKEKYGLTAKQFALAYELKNDCRDFVKDKLGIDVFTEKTEEKNIIRPLLVWYGGVKRKQSNGTYWTSLLKSRMDNDPSDVVLVSDIRYCEYEKDEVQWIKDELSGKLIHIRRYKYLFLGNNTKVYTKPPNVDEELNDPKLQDFADYKLEWEDVGDVDLTSHSYLNKQVEKCLSKILPSNG